MSKSRSSNDIMNGHPPFPGLEQKAESPRRSKELPSLPWNFSPNFIALVVGMVCATILFVAIAAMIIGQRQPAPAVVVEAFDERPRQPLQFQEVPPEVETARTVAAFKEQMRPGLSAADIFGIANIPPDKHEKYLGNDYIKDFRCSAGSGAFVARYLPFEIPGNNQPCYRVNILLVADPLPQQGTVIKFSVKDWYFRSPN